MKIFIWYDVNVPGRQHWIVLSPDIETARRVITERAGWPIAENPPDEIVDRRTPQVARILYVG